MSGLESRIKKAESAISDIGYDDQTYIDAIMRFYRGDDNGEAMAALPPYKGSPGQEAALCVKALSRVRNEANGREDICPISKVD